MLFPLLAAWQFWAASDRIRGYVHDYGVVVDTVPVRGLDRRGAAYAVIEYDGGNWTRHRIQTAQARVPPHQIGTRVPILVEPNDRQTAHLGGLFGYWGSTAVIGLLCAIATLLSAGFAWLSLRKPKHRRTAHRPQRAATDPPLPGRDHHET